MTANTNFLEELSRYCQRQGVSLDQLRPRIQPLEDEEIQAFHITRGFAPDNPNVLVDAIVVTKDRIWGIDVANVNNIITTRVLTIKVKNLTNLHLEYRQETIRVSLDTGLFELYLVDEIASESKLTEFMNQVRRVWLQTDN